MKQRTRTVRVRKRNSGPGQREREKVYKTADPDIERDRDREWNSGPGQWVRKCKSDSIWYSYSRIYAINFDWHSTRYCISKYSFPYLCIKWSAIWKGTRLLGHTVHESSSIKDYFKEKAREAREKERKKLPQIKFFSRGPNNKRGRGLAGKGRTTDKKIFF